MSIKYVEYLQGDGTSYINTIKLPGGTYNIEMKYNDDTVSTTAQNRLISLTNNSFYYQINQYGVRQVKDSNRNNEQYVDKIVNNVLTDTFTIGDNTSTLRIFYSLTVAQIYYIKLYDTSNNLLYHFRGALDNNNTPCLHEAVNDVIYYNNGVGTFSYGRFIDALYLFANNNNATAENLGSYRLYNMKIKGDSEGVESGVDYVDYLEGDGNSWINTGMTIQSNYKIEVTFMSTVSDIANPNYCSIFGVGTPPYYTYDFNPPGVSLWLERNTLKYRNNGVTTVSTSASWYNKKYTQEIITGDKVGNINNLFLFAVNEADKAIVTNPYLVGIASNYLKIYDFKIYNAEGTLIQHLKPCLDTEGVPCMYDEVSKQYFYNQGTGTFGYRKKLRDFQPVLDSNGIPCLMDKVNKKYYYDKNGKGFGCDGYSGVSYIKGDGASWIDTGIIANQIHGYRIETKIINKSVNSENTILFGSSQGGMDSADVNCHLRYNYYGYSQGLTFIEDSGTGQGWSMKVNEIYTFVMTINQPTSSNSFYLCAGNERDNAIGVCDCGIYYWKIYDTNNNLIQHLIPAIDTDGSIGMYDLVTETFHYNQGTGTFSYGIEEDECPPVNYVEYLSVKSEQQKYIHLEDIHMPSYSQDNISYEVKFKQLSQHGAVVGDVNVNVGSFPCFNRSGGKLMIRFGRTMTEFDYLRNDEVHTITYNINGGREVIANGVNLGVPTNPNNNFDYDSPIRLFNSYNNNYPNGYVTGEFYYFKIWDNGTLIHYVRPFIDDNGVTGVYDEVTGKSYMCEDIAYANPTYNSIKYIETNGTQYIDTGVVVNDNTYMDIDYRACESKTIALDYFYENHSTHYYTPKFLCSELNDTIINNSEHQLTIDYYGADGAWQFQGTVASGATSKINTSGGITYISIRFVGTATTNYVNEYTFVLGNSLASNPRNGDVTISLQDCMSIGYLMNDFCIESTYKYKEIDTTVEPNLTASAGATLTLGSTYIPYLTESEIEQAIKNGWIIQ